MTICDTCNFELPATNFGGSRGGQPKTTCIGCRKSRAREEIAQFLAIHPGWSCTPCGAELTPDNSYITGGYVKKICRPCARRDALANKNLANTYNLPPGRIEEMKREQNYCCAACGERETEKSPLVVDHDHSCCSTPAKSCGRCVRELLCSTCNKILGYSREDAVRLQGLATYKLRWS